MHQIENDLILEMLSIKKVWQCSKNDGSLKRFNKNVVEIRDPGIRYLEETYSGSRIQPPGVKKSIDP
jgi:hypothetical protein